MTDDAPQARQGPGRWSSDLKTAVAIAELTTEVRGMRGQIDDVVDRLNNLDSRYVGLGVYTAEQKTVDLRLSNLEKASNAAVSRKFALTSSIAAALATAVFGGVIEVLVRSHP